MIVRIVHQRTRFETTLEYVDERDNVVEVETLPHELRGEISPMAFAQVGGEFARALDVARTNVAAAVAKAEEVKAAGAASSKGAPAGEAEQEPPADETEKSAEGGAE